MRLFLIDSDYKVELNKEWIYLIPEFAALLKRDKGSPGDSKGEKKLKARKEFTFIYFDLDFTSPIRDWEEYERRNEAMKYAGITEADLDAGVMAAHHKYNELLLASSRSLKTLRSAEKSLDAFDTYLAAIDFTEKDKKGELVNNPNTYLQTLDRLNKAYDAVDTFRKRVSEELKGDTAIRGAAVLGRKESAKRTEWNEKVEVVRAPQVSFDDIARLQGDDDNEE